MNVRQIGTALLATSVLLSACSDDDDDDNGTGPQNNATVRFVNATGTSFDVGTGGSYGGAGMSNLAYGSGTSCMTVNAQAPALTFRQSGTNTNVGNFVPSFQAGRRYTLVVSGTPGNYTVRQFEDNFPTLTSGNAGLRVINASTSATNYNLFVGPSGSMSTTASQTGFGMGGMYTTQLAAGSTQINLGTAGSSTMTFTGTPFTTTAGTRRTVVIADAASGTGFRTFEVQPCG